MSTAPSDAETIPARVALMAVMDWRNHRAAGVGAAYFRFRRRALTLAFLQSRPSR